MKKKYLFVVPSLSKGGAERVVSILASELVKRNRNAVIVTHFRTEKEYPINNDVEVVCLSNLNETEYREKMSAIYLIKLARKLRKEIVRQNPDYILPFLWTTCVRTDFALMGLSLKERVIQTVRNNPTVFPKNSVMKKYRNRLVQKSRLTIVQNKQQKQYFPEAQWEKIKVLPNPVSLELLQVQRCEDKSQFKVVGGIFYDLMKEAGLNVICLGLGKVTKNNGNRCSAYVPEHHEAIVSPEIARAAHLVASSKKKCGVQDIVVIQQGALKGFVGIHPNWSGISVDSIHSLCLRAYLPEEVAKLNDIAEMRAGTKLEKPLRSEYLTISGTCFINQSSPVITISKNGIRFSKACHTRLDDCEHVELLYHPILQVVILRKSNRDASTAIHWENKDKICSSFSSRAFSGVIFEAMNWKWSCRYQCRGICRGEENAKFLFFELDESRILIRKNQYEQIEDRSMNLKCRLYRSKWIQSIAASDVMESGQVVENPMIGAIPSRNEVQRELDDLLMSM